MNRRKIKRVAFHEAGHLVMRWHLDLTATRTVIFENGRDCYCERADDDLSGYENKMLCLAGLAATGRAGKNYMEETLFSLLADHEFFSHETLDSGHDIERLWKTHSAPGPMTQTDLMLNFYEARYVLGKYRNHVKEAALLLMDRNEVSADDAAALFQKWGKPDVAILDQYNYSRAWKTAMDLFQPLNARDEKEVRQIQRSSLFLSKLRFDSKTGDNPLRLRRCCAGHAVMDWYLRSNHDADSELLRLASGFAAAFRRTPLLFDFAVKAWMDYPDVKLFINPELRREFDVLQRVSVARCGGRKNSAKLMLRSYYRARTILTRYSAELNEAIRSWNGETDFKPNSGVSPTPVYFCRKRLAHICRRITLNWN
jgi:hypothetical protein